MTDTQQYWASARRNFSGEWAVMTFYERFEQVVALILANVIAVVIVISLFQLIRAVLILLAGEAFHLLDHAAFQGLFGIIMTLRIAMEFKHSIIRVALRRNSHHPGQDRGVLGATRARREPARTELRSAYLTRNRRRKKPP